MQKDSKHFFFVSCRWRDGLRSELASEARDAGGAAVPRADRKGRTGLNNKWPTNQLSSSFLTLKEDGVKKMSFHLPGV